MYLKPIYVSFELILQFQLLCYCSWVWEHAPCYLPPFITTWSFNLNYYVIVLGFGSMLPAIYHHLSLHDPLIWTTMLLFLGLGACSLLFTTIYHLHDSLIWTTMLLFLGLGACSCYLPPFITYMILQSELLPFSFKHTAYYHWTHKQTMLDPLVPSYFHHCAFLNQHDLRMLISSYCTSVYSLRSPHKCIAFS